MDANVVRRRLEHEWELLLEAQDAIDREVVSGDSPADGSGEVSSMNAASTLFEREKELSIRETIEGDLEDLRDAFGRVAAGRYGVCATCGAEIPDERLEAVPSTRFCVEHERLWELHSLTLPFPIGPTEAEAASAEALAQHEALEHFEFVPDDEYDDEELLTELDVPVEEAATHIVVPDLG